MAGNNNGEFAGDVENGYGGNRVQPFPSTQMQVPLLLLFSLISLLFFRSGFYIDVVN